MFCEYFRGNILQGVFSQGLVEPLVWKTPVWEPIREVSQTIDYIGFSEVVKRSVVNLLALEYNKEAQCRVGPYLDIIDTVGCDCDGRNRDCWENTKVEQNVGSGWACPHVVTGISVCLEQANLSNLHRTAFSI